MTSTETNALLDRIEQGETHAVNLLLQKHRSRLKNLVAWRLDQRVAGRVDASDVVQNAIAKAAQRVGDYAQTRAVPFYTWLRRLVIDSIIDVHREHIRSQKRSVTRELIPDARLSDFGRKALASLMVTENTDPTDALVRQEEMEAAQHAIEQLGDSDRELLVLRYLEQVPLCEAASILGISENAFAQRHLRAIKRVRALLAQYGDGHE